MAQAKAKPVKANVKFRLGAGKATPAPPVGSILGSQGVNMMEFVNGFNDATRELGGAMLSVRVKIYEDRTFEFSYKGETTVSLIRKAAGVDKGSGTPNKTKVAKLTKAQVEEIAAQKINDMNATNPVAAFKVVAGTARSMGIEVEN